MENKNQQITCDMFRDRVGGFEVFDLVDLVAGDAF